MIGDNRIVRAAKVLADAHRTRSVLDELPRDCVPQSLQEGYQIQDELIRQLGWTVVGWKVGLTDPTKWLQRGIKEPIYGRVLEPFHHHSPAALNTTSATIIVEAEFAFRLAHDLPRRDATYSREDVVTAVGSMHLTLDLANSRYRDRQAAATWSVIADNAYSGGLVEGSSVLNWQSLDLAGQEVTLFADGKHIARGTGANVMGDPVVPLVWLANARRASRDGLRRGDIVTTGSFIGAPAVGANAEVVADFGNLGQVMLICRSSVPHSL